MNDAPRHLLLLIAVIIAIASVGMGCALGVDPSERALRRSLETTSTAVDRGLGAADADDSVPLVGRYNPCRCPAPEFELYTRGRWQRIIIVGDDEQLALLRQQAQMIHRGRQLEVLYLWGTVTGSERYEQTGVEYLLFEVSRFDIEAFERVR